MIFETIIKLSKHDRAYLISFIRYDGVIAVVNASEWRDIFNRYHIKWFDENWPFTKFYDTDVFYAKIFYDDENCKLFS